jgi:hypothetical protein
MAASTPELQSDWTDEPPEHHGLFPLQPAPVTPKRPRSESPAAVDLLPYYAGFSYEWVKGIVSQSGSGDIVLDPWNGSGTTTLAASGGHGCGLLSRRQATS